MSSKNPKVNTFGDCYLNNAVYERDGDNDHVP